MILGIHLQVGDAAQHKLVSCLKVRVLDVVADVRLESMSFNKPLTVELSQHASTALLIGKGYRHCFLSSLSGDI